MKKLFFIAAIASAALVSCTKNELAPSVTEQQEIAFAAPVVGPQTKAVLGAIDAQYDKGESFDVWSIWHEAELSAGAWAGTPYITNVAASYDGGVNGWRLATPYYWPATGFLSFVALSPSIANTTSYAEGTGFQISEWSQGATEAAIVDLMYSNATLNKKHSQFTYDSELDDDDDSGNFKYNGVDIQFNHALSYLVFQVKTVGDYSPTQFRLNAITLSGIYTTGNFTQNPTAPATNWAVDEDDEKIGTYKAYTAGTLSFTSTAVPVPETDKKEIILLPQTLTASQQTITVDYEISTDGTNWISQTKSADIVNGTVSAWEMGKKYTYTISIGVDEIIFDPAVSTWTNADGGTITF